MSDEYDYDYNKLHNKHFINIVKDRFIYLVTKTGFDDLSQRNKIYKYIQDFLNLNINKSIYVDFALKHKDVFMGEFNKNIQKLKLDFETIKIRPDYIVTMKTKVNMLKQPDPVKNPTESDLKLLTENLDLLKKIFDILKKAMNEDEKKKKFIEPYTKFMKYYNNKLKTLYEIIHLNESTVNNITETHLNKIKKKVDELINSNKKEDSIVDIEFQLLGKSLQYLTHKKIDDDDIYEYVLFFTNTNDITTLKGYFAIKIKGVENVNKIIYYNFNQTDMKTIKKTNTENVKVSENDSDDSEDENIPIRVIPRISKL